jgi:DNA-binding CsgD family transcriptional regulator
MLVEWGKTNDRYFGVPMAVAACELYASLGRVDEARTCLERLRTIAVEIESDSGEPDWIAGLRTEFNVTAGQGGAGIPEARVLLGQEVSTAEAIVARAEGRLDDAVAAWTRGLEFAQRRTRPKTVADMRHELGVTLLLRGVDGDRAAAREHLLAAKAAFDAMGAASAGEVGALLRRHRLVAPPARRAGEGLSAREMEVATLVASGHSNRQIAERLTLSAKTVEHHVSRALSKLQLPSRVALAAYIGERRTGANDDSGGA